MIAMSDDAKTEEHSRKWSTVSQWSGGASSLAELALAIPELWVMTHSTDVTRHGSTATQALWNQVDENL